MIPQHELMAPPKILVFSGHKGANGDAPLRMIEDLDALDSPAIHPPVLVLFLVLAL